MSESLAALFRRITAGVYVVGVAVVSPICWNENRQL